MKDYRLYRQDSGFGNNPPPPPPPPSFNPPPPPPPTGGSSYSPGGGMSGSASSNSIIALVLGILSFIACGIFTAIPAWVMGKKELNAINAGRSPEAGKTMAMIGMWLGIISVVLSILGIIVVILYAIFVGGFILSDLDNY